jgi:hypothetical protein
MKTQFSFLSSFDPKVTAMTRSGNDILLTFDDIMGVLECANLLSLLYIRLKSLHMCCMIKYKVVLLHTVMTYNQHTPTNYVLISFVVH